MNGVIRTQWCTIGIIYPGDMGSSLGRLLIDRGFHVVTTLDGRSVRTAQLCREVGIEVLGSLTKLVRTSDIVISLVTPGAAWDVAQHFSDCVYVADRRPAFVDANSISPDTARAIGQLMDRSRCEFIDATIHGLASRLATHAIMYLSGPTAQELATLLSPAVKTRFLSKRPGAASAHKMLMAGMSKGVVALFLEMAVAAKQLGLLDELLRGYREYYPGIMTAIERLVPTYPRHAARRGQELAELEQTIESIGLTPHLSRAARECIQLIGQLPFSDFPSHNGSPNWTMLQVIEAIHHFGGLRGEHPAPSGSANDSDETRGLAPLSCV